MATQASPHWTTVTEHCMEPQSEGRCRPWSCSSAYCLNATNVKWQQTNVTWPTPVQSTPTPNKARPEHPVWLRQRIFTIQWEKYVCAPNTQKTRGEIWHQNLAKCMFKESKDLFSNFQVLWCPFFAFFFKVLFKNILKNARAPQKSQKNAVRTPSVPWTSPA